MIPRFDRAQNAHGRDVAARKGAIVHHLFNARAGRGDLRGEISETAGAIADYRGEAAKASIGDETAFDDAAQDVWIDVAAAKQKNHALVLEFFQLTRKTGSERRGGGAFNNALLQFDHAQDRDGDLFFGDGDGLIDMRARDFKSIPADLRNGETIGECGVKRDLGRLASFERRGKTRDVFRFDGDEFSFSAAKF